MNAALVTRWPEGATGVESPRATAWPSVRRAHTKCHQRPLVTPGHTALTGNKLPGDRGLAGSRVEALAPAMALSTQLGRRGDLLGDRE